LDAEIPSRFQHHQRYVQAARINVLLKMSPVTPPTVEVRAISTRSFDPYEILLGSLGSLSFQVG